MVTNLTRRHHTLFTVVGATICAVAQFPAWTSTPVRATATTFASATLIWMGLSLIRNAKLQTLGMCVATSGLLWSFQWLTTWNQNVLPWLGVQANTWFYICGGIGLLATRSDTPLFRSERVLIALFLASGLTQVVVTLFSSPAWFGFSADVWWPSVVASRSAFDAIVLSLNVVWVSTALWFNFAVVRHLQTLNKADKAAAAPVAIGFCVVGIVGGLTSGQQSFPGATESASSFMISLIILSIPAGYGCAAIVRHLFQAILIDRLRRRLSGQEVTTAVLQSELRQLTGDATLTLSTECDDRSSMAVSTRYKTLTNQDALLESLASIGSVAVLNELLHSNVGAIREEAHAFASAIHKAPIEERERIERELRDGLEYQLKDIEGKLAAVDATSSSVVLLELSVDIQTTIAALRNFAGTKPRHAPTSEASSK